MESLILVTALVAGFVHALEADHVAAVTTFVSRNPRPMQALRFGLRWGLGHAAAIVAVGTVLVALDLRVPETLERGLEFGVGGVLVALGAWLLWSVLHERAHGAVRAPGAEPAEASHRHGSAWVGVAHGLAGTAPLVALLAATTGQTAGAAAAYLLFFGVGTTVAMGVYALAAGALVHHAGRRAPRVGGAFRAVTAVGSAVVGVAWMYAAVT